MRHNLIYSGDHVAFAGAWWEVLDVIPGAEPDGRALYIFRLGYMGGTREAAYASRTQIDIKTDNPGVRYLNPMEVLALAASV